MISSKLHTAVNNYKQSLDSYDHYIAIDWSQVNIALARMTQRRAKVNIVEWRRSDVKLVKEYLSNLKGSIILSIEETTTSHWLYVELKDLVERIVICDPYRNRLLSDGPKTDKIDAGKLCELLRGGLLKEVFHSCDVLFELRQLYSAYEDLVKSGVRIQNQRSAVYRSQGLRYKKSESGQLRQQINSKGFFRIISDWQDRNIEQYFADKTYFEELIEKQVNKDKITKNLTKLPGIGRINAFKIRAVVIQAERFRNKGSYLSYCGLVLLEKSSGNKSYGKRMPRFNRILKGVYISAARTSIHGGNNPMYEYYQELLEQKGLNHKQATLMIARHLAKISLGMMKNGEKYEPYRWRKDDVDSAA